MLFSWLPLEGGGGADMGAFLGLSVVLFLAVTVPLVFSRLRRWRVPVVVGEILAGILVGRSGFGWVDPNDTILRLLAEIGFVFLMFLAGMEIDLSALAAQRGGSRAAANANGENGQRIHPLRLAVGHYALTLVFALGVGWVLWQMGWVTSAVLMAFILSTTSVDIVMLVLKERGLLGGRYGQTLFLAALLADFVSILLITVYVTFLSKGPTLEVLLVGLLFVALFAMYRLGIWVLPGLRPLLDELAHATTHIKVRVAFWIFVAFVALAELLGVEVILGAFLAGMLIRMLSTSEDAETRHQLESMGYGFFVPIFFIMVGAKFNLEAFTQAGASAWLLLPILGFGAVFLKLAPAVLFVPAFGWKDGLAGGVLLSARLSLIIAAAEIGLRMGVIHEAVVAAIILVAVTTVVVAPWLFARLVPAGHTAEAAHPIVVVGAGHLGTHLATLIQQHHHPVVLLDDDPQRVERARQHGLQAIVARPQAVAAVEPLEQATTAVITLSDPEKTLAWARWMQSHFGLPHVLVLNPDGTVREELARLGLQALTPLEAQATFLALMARNPDFMHMLISEADQRDVQAVVLRNPECHGRRIRDLDWPPDVLILAVQRDGEYLIPRGNTRLQQGDIITLLGTPEALEAMRQRMERRG